MSAAPAADVTASAAAGSGGPSRVGHAAAQPAAAGPAAPAIDAARLRTAILRLSRHLRKHDLAGLTPTQLSALATVVRDGPLRLGDLAAAERIAPSTLTRLVSVLEEHDYVRRAGVPGDARAWLVCATEQGTAMLNRIRQETTSLLADDLARLSGEQLTALAAAMPALELLSDPRPAQLSGAGGIRTAGC